LPPIPAGTPLAGAPSLIPTFSRREKGKGSGVRDGGGEGNDHGESLFHDSGRRIAMIVRLKQAKNVYYASRIIRQYWYFMVPALPATIAAKAMKEPIDSVEIPVTP